VASATARRDHRAALALSTAAPARRSGRIAREMKAFRAFLKNLGYRCWDESKNPAYRLFLGQ
jgi:hypothetical protein